MFDINEGDSIDKVSTYHSILDDKYGENEVFVID